MRWPWQRAEKDERLVEEAKARLDDVLSDWPDVKQATDLLRTHRVRNHITEKAFALRERST